MRVLPVQTQWHSAGGKAIHETQQKIHDQVREKSMGVAVITQLASVLCSASF